jgi:hypothetical protein
MNPVRINALFERTAEKQYTKELLFSTSVDIMAAVACRIHPSVHAAYQADIEGVGVSVRALYDKLAHTETALSEELVRHIAGILKPLLRRIGGLQPPLVEGYTTATIWPPANADSWVCATPPPVPCPARLWWCWNPNINSPPTCSAARTATPRSVPCSAMC